MIAADPHDLERFRLGVARWFGLQFDETKSGILHDALVRRLQQTGLRGPAYLDRLEGASASAAELRELARELTVGETYFYRNIDQFRALTEAILPERMTARDRAHTRTLALLSAGCASGEEAYSLAMAVRDVVPDLDWKVSILGIDVNPTALEKAAAARYSAWSLREIPAEVQRRWFHAHGREVVVIPTIRASVRFEEHNLSDENPVLWPPATYDVIFCRNVLMYFTPEGARAVLARLTRSLVPGGYLFLGHAETLRGLSNDFHLCHTHGTFYYQRKDPLAGGRPLAAADVRPFVEPPPMARSNAPSPVESPPADWSVEWIETIRRASERITALTKDALPAAVGDRLIGAATDSPGPGPSDRRAAPDLTVALDLLAKERYSEALALLHELPRGSADDPDTLLLRAVLQTHRGNLSQAEATCSDLLAADEMNAGAHYLLALCRENAGDRRGAADHHQTAAYLDPTFAMPRLHAGILARREGELETARRELCHALPLLLREEASRLLLFGAGFTRGALVALCRAELTAAGGTP